MGIMLVLRAARMASILPTTATRTAFVAPVLRLNAQVGLATDLHKRNAGASVIGAGVALTGVGMSTIGIGLIFTGLVQGIARNPAMKEDLFTYALIGMGLVEFFAIVNMVGAGLLLYS